MAPDRRATMTIAGVGIANFVILTLLWAFVAPALLGLPRSWWDDNFYAAAGMAVVVQLLHGAINVLFRVRWRRHRTAELPIRQLLSALFACTAAVLVGWAVVLHRIGAPYGLALAATQMGLGVIASLALMVGGRLLLRWGSVPRSSGHSSLTSAPRLSWSRIGLRGYLLFMVVLLGTSVTLIIVAYAHVAAHVQSVQQRLHTSAALLDLVARRVEAVPRARVLTKVWRTRLPTGYVLRVVKRDGRTYFGDESQATPGPARKSRARADTRIALKPGGVCLSATAFAAGCRWVPLRYPHEGLALVAFVWPMSNESSGSILLSLVLFGFALIGLAGLIAYLMGADVSEELDQVALRIRAIVERAEYGLGAPLQPSSSDEMGELVHEFGRLRRALVDELEPSRQDLSRSVAIDRQRTAFLGEASFELRTPLTAIIGNGELLLEGAWGELNAEQAQDAQIVLDSSRQLLGLVQDIMDISISEAGGLRLRPEATDVAELVRSALTSARAGLDESQVTLRAELPDDLPEVVLDPARIRRVLANLLTNAVKFTEAGEIVIRVARRSREWVEISVRDTGTGIAGKHHEAVFEQYRQAPQKRPKQLRGSGLGLAIARRLVQLHGGRIWLESKPEEGSEFFFSLPVQGPPQVGGSDSEVTDGEHFEESP